MKALKIFSGTSNPILAERVASGLFTKLGDIYHHKFPSGESYCQYKENIRGCDVFLIQGITNPANENLMELLVMADAARRASANRITAVIPYFGYARQDRKDKSRVPISAKLVLDLIEASGINRVLTMDLHSPQTCGFTNLPFDHLTFEPVLFEYINKNFDKNDLIIMAPDVGAVKRAEKYASLLKCDFGFISKKRLGDEKVEFQNLVGDVDEKNVIIIDDLTESCGTLIQAAKACKNNGTKDVICAVTHGAFTNTGRERLSESMRDCIDKFVYSNTITDTWSGVVDAVSTTTKPVRPNELIELDVSPLFSKAINSIHNNESVSELFL
jgi:ribose-phosphate pyrophosphokinase